MKTVYNNRKEKLFTTDAICSSFSLKRDAYYKYQKRYVAGKKVGETVVRLVKKSRRTLPREGTRKLIKSLKEDFQKNNLKIGRVQLFRILRESRMLVRRKKYSSRTTNSHHRFYKYGNIIKDLVIDRPNKVWAADITYIRTINGFCYLALITDMHSRKIVGYDLSDSLELKGCIRTLKKALYHNRIVEKLIHHSDRGIQYCNNLYTNELKRKKIDISMTEESLCYENALAERVNGILKDEFISTRPLLALFKLKKLPKMQSNFTILKDCIYL